MRVCKIFRFDAAHYLPEYDGKCKNMHGHGWRLEVELEGNVEADGMVLDFSELKRVVNHLVIDHLDHRLLNDVIVNPTCENLLIWIAEVLCPKVVDYKELKKAANVAGVEYLHLISRLRLYETPDSYAEEVYK